jgi:hypothetical protein
MQRKFIGTVGGVTACIWYIFKSPILGYKSFDDNWKCIDMQYNIGETFKHDGNVKLCNSGLHAGLTPSECNWYYPHNSKHALVYAFGKIDSNSRKFAAANLTIVREISNAEWNFLSRLPLGFLQQMKLGARKMVCGQKR